MTTNQIKDDAAAGATAKKTFLARLFSAKGRMNRSQYLACYVLDMLFFVLMNILLSELQYKTTLMNVLAWVFLLVLLASSYSLIVVMVQRFHDLGRTGWEAFTLVIPFYNIFVIVLLFFYKGTTGVNKYGPDPLVHHA